MYTVEVFKADRRTKKGERRVFKQDYETDNLSMLEHTVEHVWRAAEGYRYEIHETYVTRTSAMDGTPFRERYDTPRACSPASELYWSM